MRKIFFLFISICMSLQLLARDFTEYVNPLVGSASSFALSTGNTYPAIARPWGMNFYTPQTGKAGDGWQYVYSAHKIRGIKQTHQPSPWINDYGQFSVMAVTGQLEMDEEKRASWFSHKAEVARPNYYSVYLADWDVKAEVAPTERAAVMRFTCPEDMTYIVVDAMDDKSGFEIDSVKRLLTGYTTKNSGGVPANFKNYFVMRFDQPIVSVHREGRYAAVGFKTKRGEQINVHVASSFISTQQAMVNLMEVAGRSLEAVADEGRAVWNEVLSRIDVEGGSDEQYRTFYSCLYRSLLFPRKFYEINAQGKVMHYSPYNGKVLPGYMYTDTGFWDTFRALFPLLNICYRSTNLEIQEGLINAYKESGFFPEWASPGHRGCMVGNNSASVLADAYLKGVRVKDVETLYEGLLHGTKAVHPTEKSTGRLGYEYYNKLGYVPYDVGINESAARTLEYAYDDWCILQLAKELKRPKAEIEMLEKRAQNYRLLFDPEHKLMRGKNKDGSFQSPFSPLKWGDAFTEGNAWHYTWSVFHDVKGLMALMGGKKDFVAMLDSVFDVPPHFDESYYGQVIHEIREMQVMNMGNYAHGNQPIQHMIYLYDYAGEPHKTQMHAREVMDRLYTSAPDGYCGDEDNGQTSAWYVFSAMGFYPVCPGQDDYALGSPLFKQVKIHLENGNTMSIVAPNNSKKNVLVKKMWLDGKVYKRNFLNFKSLMKGGELKMEMEPITAVKGLN